MAVWRLDLGCRIVSVRAQVLCCTLHTTQQCTGQIWMLDFYGGTSCGAPRPAALHASRGRREGTCMRQRDGRCLPLRVPLLLLLLRRRVNGRSFRANSFREFTTAAASHEMNGSRGFAVKTEHVVLVSLAEAIVAGRRGSSV
jgi:hypothetical protein